MCPDGETAVTSISAGLDGGNPGIENSVHAPCRGWGTCHLSSLRPLTFTRQQNTAGSFRIRRRTAPDCKSA